MKYSTQNTAVRRPLTEAEMKMITGGTVAETLPDSDLSQGEANQTFKRITDANMQVATAEQRNQI